ncbi:MAG: DUF4158 domain-containing protein, partial [Chitinimonas sp.]|nr:DUF4158 domain-containing protein [Chitinimonas sp.]
MSASDSHRLVILSTEEIDELYGLPKFSEDDRQLYYDFSPPERAAIEARTFSVGIYLALELGFFRAKRQFFALEQADVISELRHLSDRYFSGRALDQVKLPSRPTRAAIQQDVLALFNYRLCDADAKEELEQRARRAAVLSTQPLYLLREVLQHLSNQRVVAPLYTSLQDMIGRVLSDERKRVTQLLASSAPAAVLEHLDRLLHADEHMYRIRALRREPKDFSHSELKREVERRKFFQPLHEFAQTFLGEAGLSNESGKYYASLVKYYTAYKLQRMQKGAARLYLLCFAFHRFRQINDNLIEAFIYLVDHYEKLARRAADEAMKKAIEAASDNLEAAGEVLTLFIDESIPVQTPFADVQERAFTLLERETIPTVADYLRNIAFDKGKAEWSYYTSLSMTIKRNIRHLFAELEFGGRIEDAPLISAVNFLQGIFRQGKSPRQVDLALFPTGLIPKALRAYLYQQPESQPDADDDGEKQEQLDVDRYEYLVYRQLRNALEAGDLYVKESNEFRRFEDDLISDTRWEDKDAVLQDIGLPILLRPIEETLVIFREALETRYTQVNQRILEAANEHIKVKGRAEKRRWTLIYPTAEEPVNNPFYSRLPGIGIADLLRFVGSRTGFLDAFTHVLERNVKTEPDPREVLACIVALGTNMGVWKMAEVSGMSSAALLLASRNYLRPETLR